MKKLLKKTSLVKIVLGTAIFLFQTEKAFTATIPNLSPGSQFRYVFVTSTGRDATSIDINDYNDFVNNVAVSGTETNSILGDWKVIASTATVNARENTNTLTPRFPNPDRGLPIFGLDGVQIAANYDQFWGGDLDNPINVDENGNVIPRSPLQFVFTGSNRSGSVGGVIIPLGETGGAMDQLSPQVGRVGFNGSDLWIDTGNLSTSGSINTPLPFYAMSSIQTVEETTTPIPEPLTILGAGTAIAFGAGFKRKLAKAKKK